MYIKPLFIALLFLTISTDGFSFDHKSRCRSKPYFKLSFILIVSDSNAKNVKKMKARFAEREYMEIKTDSITHIYDVYPNYITCVTRKYRYRITDLFNKNISIRAIRIKKKRGYDSDLGIF